MRRLLGALFLLVLIGAIWLGQAVRTPGPLPAAINFVVPREGIAPLSRRLAAAGIVRSPLLFRIATTISRPAGPLHAAELAFPAHASVVEVLTILRTGKPVIHRLTIPEGLTARQIGALLAAAPATQGPVPPLREGEIFPDTYDYLYGTPRRALVARARARMDRILAEEWDNRAPGLPLSTPTQALTLASLVERETALPAERPLVAAVFLNRLRLGMKLESDPTVVYGASQGQGRLDRPISRADLAAQSAYNTYRIPGLPPGPIASPGRAAIHAVLHPAATGDLYFVANGTGGHSFAETLDAHLRNVAKWRNLGH